MTKPIELRTERLLLRPFSLSDIDAVHEYASDPEWAAYYPRPYDRGRAEYVIAQAVLTSWDKGAAFAVVYDGRVIGLVSLRVDPEDEDRKAELGYDVARDMWGQGLAPEAASAVCDWGFREYGLAKVYALADARNGRSLQVMERLGMTREAIHRSDEVERGERVDGVCYAVLRSGWSGPAGPLEPVTAPPEEWNTTDRDDIPELTTPRLLLRPFGPGDVDDVLEYAQGPRVGGVSPGLTTAAVHAAKRGGVRRQQDDGAAHGALVGHRAGWRRYRWDNLERRLEARDRRDRLRFGEIALGARAHDGGRRYGSRLGVSRARTGQNFVPG